MCRRLAKDVGVVGDRPRKKVAAKSPKYFGGPAGTWDTSEFLKHWKDLVSTQASATQTSIINDLEKAYKNYKSNVEPLEKIKARNREFELK